jgi:hypothetical protein
MSHKEEIVKKTLCFEVLDVLFGGLEDSSVQLESPS